MINTLYTRLSAALLGIFCLVGIGFLIIASWATESYYEEVTQRLNQDIPMYITEAEPLIEQGVANQRAVRQLADKVMIINPSVEVYLLDAKGQILSNSLPSNTVLRNAVDLKPLRLFLDGKTPLPIKGDDPRHADASKIFSVAPVHDGGQLQGYLYTIFGGSKYDALASELRQSYVLQISGWAILAILVFGFLTSLVTFSALTKRLRRLTAAIETFRRNKFTQPVVVDGPTRSRDEIGRLSLSFNEMASHIASQLKQLENKDSLRRELTANISHDLRTPLTLMQGYIDTLLIKHGQLSDSQQLEYLSIASKHAAHLNRLVGELFELAQLDSGNVKPSLERFSLAELLNDVAQKFKILAKEKRVSIAARLDNRGLFVRGDIALIERALENLLDNALRATPAGGHVRIRAAMQKDGMVAVSIRDTGFGIPADQLPRIFDRSFRVEDANTKNSRGTGLGLAIVKRIMELHNSTITVESQINAGTCFRFRLAALAA